MPCSHCGSTGHNIRTCPQLNRINRDILLPEPRLLPEPQLLPQNNLIPQPPDYDPPIQPIQPIQPQQPIQQIWMNDIIINDNHNDNIIQDVNQDVNQNVNQNYEFGVINKLDIVIHNMRNENFILYLVSGNLSVWDLDTTENDLHYIGIINASSSFDMKRCIGARMLVIPYGNNIEHPEFHPPTDRKLWTKYYCKIDINTTHRDNKDIYIDDGNKLSELNKWKFNSLKLDFLLKELIKLGGKNYENLEPILDLHQDIRLDNHTEFEKDRSGIPSSLTNIT